MSNVNVVGLVIENVLNRIFDSSVAPFITGIVSDSEITSRTSSVGFRQNVRFENDSLFCYLSFPRQKYSLLRREASEFVTLFVVQCIALHTPESRGIDSSPSRYRIASSMTRSVSRTMPQFVETRAKPSAPPEAIERIMRRHLRLDAPRGPLIQYDMVYRMAG
jgi:hypothetical protein